MKTFLTTLKRFWNFILKNSLWLVGLGLMLASSGIDGTYMAQWMDTPLMGLGYILNTVADICSMALTYWFGRLQQTPKNEKGAKYKRSMSYTLIPVEAIAILYSWFFSWRQLRKRMYIIENDPLMVRLGHNELGFVEVEVIAFLCAGFIPIMLAAVGLVQSLLAGRIEKVEEDQVGDSTTIYTKKKKTRMKLADWREFVVNPDGNRAEIARITMVSKASRAQVVNDILESCGYLTLPPSTARDWGKIAFELLKDWEEEACQEE